MRSCARAILICLLVPQVAWASDYSGLVPFYIAFVVAIGGFVAGIEWMIINAVTDRGDRAGDEDPAAHKKRRFGCGLGVLLWFVNSVIVHFVIHAIWG